ncbi:MAG: chorismate synthase, partial [Anaerolineae bacterium]
MRFLTAGESHGPALMAIIEGLPSGLEIAVEDINLQLRRRQKGYGRSE